MTQLVSADVALALQNILGHFPVEQQKAIRARIIQLVLITDMSEHFEFAGRVSAPPFPKKPSGLSHLHHFA